MADLARHYERAKVTVDVTDESTLLELLKREGTWTDGVRFTAAHKAEMVMGLQILFERRELVLLPEHHELLRELQFYEAVVAKSGHVRYGAPDSSKIHDDLVRA